MHSVSEMIVAGRITTRENIYFKENSCRFIISFPKDTEYNTTKELVCITNGAVTLPRSSIVNPRPVCAIDRKIKTCEEQHFSKIDIAV